MFCFSIFFQQITFSPELSSIYQPTLFSHEAQQVPPSHTRCPYAPNCVCVPLYIYHIALRHNHPHLPHSNPHHISTQLINCVALIFRYLSFVPRPGFDTNAAADVTLSVITSTIKTTRTQTSQHSTSPENNITHHSTSLNSITNKHHHITEPSNSPKTASISKPKTTKTRR